MRRLWIPLTEKFLVIVHSACAQPRMEWAMCNISQLDRPMPDTDQCTEDLPSLPLAGDPGEPMVLKPLEDTTLTQIMEQRELPVLLVNEVGGVCGVLEAHVEFLKKHFHLITMKEFLKNKKH
ncbi:unnamed protein product [Caretta caretta]